MATGEIQTCKKEFKPSFLVNPFEVMEFESTPSLPPPFTIITHIYQLIQYYSTKNEEDRARLMDDSLSWSYDKNDSIRYLQRRLCRLMD